ncbi:MAG: hydroxymethylglutaryl-CoA lyase [Cyclobacteriaceae bacterium]
MKIIECPRDAMQGLTEFVPTSLKARYINQLLKVGFDTIDFGSFVSPKAIPQMRDTADVLAQLDLSQSDTKLLAIIANQRGAQIACDFEEINQLGYPLSLSETFQLRNTNRTIDVALDDLAEIQELCESEDKQLVVYLSMSFGNPYGDPYETAYVEEFVNRLDQLEVGVISLSDTVGVSHPDIINDLFETLIPKFPHIEFGAHLHSTPDTRNEKLLAAYESGCRRIDGAIMGFGGCPMAKDELVGNMATENIVQLLDKMEQKHGLDLTAFGKAKSIANEIFTNLSRQA